MSGKSANTPASVSKKPDEKGVTATSTTGGEDRLGSARVETSKIKYESSFSHYENMKIEYEYQHRSSIES